VEINSAWTGEKIDEFFDEKYEFGFEENVKNDFCRIIVFFFVLFTIFFL